MPTISTTRSKVRGPRLGLRISGAAIGAMTIVSVALLHVDATPVPLRPIVYSHPAAAALTVTAPPGGRPAASGSASVIATAVLRARHARQGGQRRRDPRVHGLDAARSGR